MLKEEYYPSVQTILFQRINDMDLSTIILMIMALTLGVPKDSPRNAINTYDARSAAVALTLTDATPQEIAEMIVLGWEESRFKLNAIGGSGLDLCVYQVMHAPRSVLTDMNECTMRGLAAWRHWKIICPEHPNAGYNTGKCSSDLGIRRARWREAEIKRIMQIATQ